MFMFKFAIVFAYFVCVFVYAADGLTLYTDPDFPDFSFEYDAAEWRLEQPPVDPNFPNDLKIVIARNSSGEELKFTFSKLIETG
jgi:hypothetical protein